MKVSIKIILWLSAKQSGDNMIDEGKMMNVQAHIDRHPIRSLLRSRREESQDGESWKEKKIKWRTYDGEREVEFNMQEMDRNGKKTGWKQRKTMTDKTRSESEIKEATPSSREFNHKQVSVAYYGQ